MSVAASSVKKIEDAFDLIDKALSSGDSNPDMREATERCVMQMTRGEDYLNLRAFLKGLLQ